MSGNASARLPGALVLSVALALACGETPTEPDSATAALDTQERTAAGDVTRDATEGDAREAPDRVGEAGPALTPEGLRSRLEDPLVQELLAGLEDAALRASVEASLAPLAGIPSDETASFRADLGAAREIVRKASLQGSLSADDQIALGALRLTLGAGETTM